MIMSDFCQLYNVATHNVTRAAAVRGWVLVTA